MTATGAIILSTMGSICMGVAASAAGWARVPLMLGAGMLWLTLMSAAQYLRKRAIAPSEAEQKRVGRLVTYASVGEGVAIFVGINIVINLGHPEWVNSVIAGVVGLHFIPLARGLPAPPYYATAVALVGAAALGLTFTDLALQRMVVFCACATILWATSAVVLLRVNARAGASDTHDNSKV